MTKYLYYLVLAAFLFANCGKQQPLDEADLIYLGEWSSSDYFIEIAANGYGFCQRRNRDSFEGNVFIRNDKIIFKGTGENGGKHKFDIDEPPFEENGEIMMKLDGDLFYKH